MDAYAHITEALEQAFLDQACFREHELIKRCQALGLSPFDELNLRHSLDLFRAHFIMRHCLYALQYKWRSEQSADINIELVIITKLPYSASSSSDISSNIAAKPLLQQYYSDLDNLINVSETEVTFLLKGFWQKFEHESQRTYALSVLQLQSNASYQEIKTRFRQLAQKAHPDKGGSSQEFQEIVEAKQALKALFL